MAKLLHVSVPEKLKRKFPLDIELTDDFKSELIEFDIERNSPAIGKAVVQLRLPKTAIIVLIHRKGKYLTADGHTIFEQGDHLLILADKPGTVTAVHKCFDEVTTKA